MGNRRRKDPLRSFYDGELYNWSFNKPRHPFPLVVDLENTNHCNFKCIFCYRKSMTREKGFMSLDLFRKFVDEGAEKGLLGIRVGGWGEPLVQKDIYEMVRYASEKNISIEVVTNGFHLNEDNSRRLVEGGCRKIKISFQGYDEKQYREERNNPHYQRIVTNVNSLVKIRNELDSEMFIQVSTSAVEKDKERASEFIQEWEKVVDNVYCDITALNHLKDHEEIKDLFERQTKKAKLREALCTRVLSLLFIAWDGRVSICCSDYNMENVVGDLNCQTMEEIWNSQELENYRQILARNEKHRIKICSNCYSLR